MRKPFKVIAIVLGSLVLLAGAVRGFMVWNQRREVLPDFVDVPPGKRAPPFDLLKLRPGVTTLAEVQAWTAERKLSCKNISMRALMAEGREAVRAEMSRVAAEGGDADAVSGASRANYYSKKERNPQVKLYCGDVDVAAALGEEYGVTSDGSFTFVFDSETHPLRYVMFDRKFQSNRTTFEQWNTSVSHWESLLGAPTKVSEIQPTEDGDDTTKIFPRRRFFNREWRFTDRRVEVTALNFGPPKGIDLRIVAEVPWPVTTLP